MKDTTDKLYRDVIAAYVLWLICGLLGGHKFYLGRPWMGLLYFCTAGLLVIGWIIDLFTLRDQVEEYNQHIDSLFDVYDDEIVALEAEIDELSSQIERVDLEHTKAGD